jgi:hypothetical protein
MKNKLKLVRNLIYAGAMGMSIYLFKIGSPDKLNIHIGLAMAIAVFICVFLLWLTDVDQEP